jgi:hypothetical protein
VIENLILTTEESGVGLTYPKHPQVATVLTMEQLECTHSVQISGFPLHQHIKPIQSILSFQIVFPDPHSTFLFPLRPPTPRPDFRSGLLRFKLFYKYLGK